VSLVDSASFLLLAHWRRRALRRWIAAGQPTAPQSPPPPQLVWIYWAQGEAAAPPVVRRCIDSWRRLNPGWRLEVLDRDSEAAIVDMSDLPETLPLAYRADILRLRLLRDRGGVWADATCLCHRPLNDWLPMLTPSGFFAWSRPGPDRLLANWFLAAAPDNALVKGWERAAAAWWRRNPRRRTFYFATHYQLEWAMRRDPAIRDVWARTPRLSASRPLALQTALDDPAQGAGALAALAAGTPMSKLTHKRPLNFADLGALLDAATSPDLPTRALTS